MMALQSANFRIHIEGTIGAGKSTLLSQFEGNSQVTFIQEHVERWQNVPGVCGEGKNLFAKFYADPGRWAHTFETYVLLTKAESHQLVVPTRVKLMERSVHSAALVFSELLHRQRIMNELEHALSMEHFRHHVQDGKCDVDLWIYLRTPARVAFDRIQKRAREEEIGVITIDYMEALERQYDDFYDKLEGPKIKIDGCASVDEVFHQTKEQLSRVSPGDVFQALYT